LYLLFVIYLPVRTDARVGSENLDIEFYNFSFDL
jgi:hypothetical protein